MNRRKCWQIKLFPTVTPPSPAGIALVDIEHELRRSYLGYAVSTLVSRALPDVRDGFKPVQRRILYAMRDLGIGPNSARVKSAKVIGECFVAGTLVSTPKGLTPIEALNIGDAVYTQNGIRPVTETYIMPEQPLLEVELSNGMKNVCTPGQQFKVLTQNCDPVWRDAIDLQSGDRILCRPAELGPDVHAPVQAACVVASVAAAPAQVTYDIQVAQDHEFIANGDARAQLYGQLSSARRRRYLRDAGAYGAGLFAPLPAD